MWAMLTYVGYAILGLATCMALAAGGLFTFLHLRWKSSRNPSLPLLGPLTFPLGSVSHFASLASFAGIRREFNLYRHIQTAFDNPSRFLLPPLQRVTTSNDDDALNDDDGEGQPRAFQLFLGPRSIIVVRKRADIEATLKSKVAVARMVSPMGNLLFEQMGIVFVSDMAKHKAHRSAALRGLMRPSYLRNLYSSTMVPVVSQFLAHLENSAPNSGLPQVMDVEAISGITLEVIGEATLSLALGCFPRPNIPTQEPVLREFRSAVSGLLRGLAFFQSKPSFLMRFYSTEYNNALSSKATVRAFMESFIDARVQDRVNNTLPADHQDDFLDVMLDGDTSSSGSGSGSGNSEHFTRADIAFTLQDMMIAGHETTSHTVAWALFFLAQDEGLQARIYAEVTSSDWGVDGHPEFNSLSSFDLLHSTIKETLRCRPTVPSLPRRTLEDTVINGIEVPANTTVFCALATLGMDPTEYANPTVFNPDRWLENPSLKTPLPFGAGPRSCVGERMALVEAKLILAMFIRAYTFDLVTPVSDVGSFQAITMHPDPELLLNIHRRPTTT